MACYTGVRNAWRYDNFSCVFCLHVFSRSQWYRWKCPAKTFIFRTQLSNTVLHFVAQCFHFVVLIQYWYAIIVTCFVCYYFCDFPLFRTLIFRHTSKNADFGTHMENNQISDNKLESAGMYGQCNNMYISIDMSKLTPMCVHVCVTIDWPGWMENEWAQFMVSITNAMSYEIESSIVLVEFHKAAIFSIFLRTRTNNLSHSSFWTTDSQLR